MTPNSLQYSFFLGEERGRRAALYVKISLSLSFFYPGYTGSCCIKQASLVVCGLRCRTACGLYLAVESGGYSPVVVCGLLIAVASLVAKHGL